ncbi:MAG TPA: hypothetical protein VFJ16_10075 [Longimicrobium sp.]|nr:hypothetical protein [Longimicrobium sp.]
MMLLLWLMVLAVVAGVTPFAVAHYRGRLPYAPECPHCRAVTSQSHGHGLVDQICAVLAATPVRSCARCGWAGRMRWRLAHERVRNGSNKR